MLETAQPYGVSKALAEVLMRTREHMEANECAEVARHVRLLIDRSGLGQPEFASRIGVPTDQFAAYLDGRTSPSASLMIRMRRLSDRFAKMRSERSDRSELTLAAVSPTFVLIPGAGGSAWYWHCVTPLLSAAGADVIAVDLPAADDSADLSTYADIVCAAAAGLDGPWCWSHSRWARSRRRWSPGGLPKPR